MRRGGWGVLVVLSLSGCAGAPVTIAPHGLNPVALGRFELDGRLAVHYRADSSMASIHWQHSLASDSLILSSPLGQTLGVLTRDNNGVRLLDSQQQTHSAPTVAALTEQLLGWRLPMEDLTYWIVGSVVPNQAYQLQAETARHGMQLTQSGWVVSYDRWQPVAGISLPVKLTLTGHGVQVRLVISDWHLAGMK